MLNNNVAIKYETTYKGSFEKIKCWTNGTVTLKYDATKISHNIDCIKTYTPNKKVEDNIFLK